MRSTAPLLACAALAVPALSQLPSSGADSLLFDTDANVPPSGPLEDGSALRGTALGRLWATGFLEGLNAQAWSLSNGAAELQPLVTLSKNPESGAGGSLAEIAELPNGLALLVIADSLGDYRLFASDGTSAGTVDLGVEVDRQAYTTANGARPRVRGLIVRGSQALFVGTAGATGRAIYSTDGTVAGTVLREELVAGPDDDGLRFLWPFGSGVAYETRQQFGPIIDLRFLDAAGGSSRVLVPQGPTTGSFRFEPVEAGGRLLFSWSTAGGSTDIEPWSSDGTAAGTAELVDLSLNSAGSEPQFLDASANLAYFSANTPAEGRELWATDGTAAGTSLVIDLAPGGTSGFPSPFPSSRRVAAMLGDGLVFRGASPSEGAEPWFTDGTAAGTVLLGDVVPGIQGSNPFEVTPLGSGVAFVAGDFAAGLAGLQPWFTDGSPAGTLQLTAGPGAAVQQAADFAEFGGALYFSARNSAADPGIYRWTGSAVEFVDKVGEPQGTLSGDPATFRSVGGRGYFRARLSSTSDQELWVTDGTTAGTSVVPGSSSSLLQPMGTLERSLMFARRPGGAFGPIEPWISDGTAAGTLSLKGATDLRVATGIPVGPLNPQLGRHLYFIGSTAAAGRELWRTDGTAAGTTLVTDGVAGAADGAVWGTTSRVGNAILYRGLDGGVERLWRSAGAAAAPLAAAQLTARELGDTAAVGERLAFIAIPDGSVQQYELWITDGTDSGTSLVRAAAGEALQLGAAGERLVVLEEGRLIAVDLAGQAQDLVPGFSGGLGTIDLEQAELGELVAFRVKLGGPAEPGLWATDGTLAGTEFISDQFGSSFREALGDSGSFLFSRSTIDEGQELWMSDGTTAGTALALDAAPGAPGTSPSVSGAIVGGLQLFSGFRLAEGREVHGLDVIAAGGYVARAFGSGCGAAGPAPDLRLMGEPRLGAAVAFELSDFVPTSLARIYLSLGVTSQAFGGCQIYLAGPVQPLATLAVDGSGAGSLALSIPAEPALLGLPLFFQAAGTGPGGPAPGGLELSDGFELRIGMP